MKLIDLTIRELYGYYDYDVKFNEDITFIYGANGCGKTTVLNITEAIITGQLYKLFDYKFKSIELGYAKKESTAKRERIFLEYQGGNLQVEFKKEKYVLTLTDLSHKDASLFQDSFYEDRYSGKIFREYIEMYPFLKEIEKTFNYVYLSLNRFSTDYDNLDFNEQYFSLRKFYNEFYEDNVTNTNFKKVDKSMLMVEVLIYDSYFKMMRSINKIDVNFRNDILKSLLKIDHVYEYKQIVHEIASQEDFIGHLERSRIAYAKVLKELHIVNEDKETYIDFFSNMIKDFKEFIDNDFVGFDVNYLLKYQEISRIQELVTITESADRKKSNARQPIENFLKIMNDFISNDVDGKKLYINDTGRIFFTTNFNNKPINIQYLSSGEKQLLTFFSNLIFKVKSGSSGIFVVDEPELSLHLSWQKKFIDRMLKVNKNVQFIFATHAPEIIGKNRDKMYKLEKRFIKKV